MEMGAGTIFIRAHRHCRTSGTLRRLNDADASHCFGAERAERECSNDKAQTTSVRAFVVLC